MGTISEKIEIENDDIGSSKMVLLTVDYQSTADIIVIGKDFNNLYVTRTELSLLIDMTKKCLDKKGLTL